jgi:hypothetical protein
MSPFILWLDIVALAWLVWGMVKRKTIGPASIPMRLLELRKNTEQINRRREKLAVVIGLIVAGIFGRRDVFPNLVKRHVSCVTLKGRRFLCRKGTSDYWHLTYTCEAETTEFLSGQHGEVFLDVGAHIGRYAVLLAGRIS